LEAGVLRVKGRRWLLAAAVFPLVLAACTSTAGRPAPGTGTAGTPAGSGPAAPGGLRAVRHVWVIELENQGYQQSFGTPSADPYMARTLPRLGALLEDYYGIGHASAANYVAEVSGQAPSVGTHPGRTGPGGGRTGAVLLSPLIKPGTVSTVPYNHYSLLRTIEDIFGLPHLGNAAMPQVRSFGPDIFG
jgi:hypothetical protein